MLPTPEIKRFQPFVPFQGLESENEEMLTNMLGNLSAMMEGYPSQTIGRTSQLNPLFVAEMMGFPLMWTVLPFLSPNGGRNQSKDMETP